MKRNLLITGSRKSSESAYEFLYNFFWDGFGIKDNPDHRIGDDIHIIVGDANGIDEAVIRLCQKFGIPHTVFGAKGLLRNKTSLGKNVIMGTGYLARDMHMAGISDICLAVWNGRSNGTRYTYEKAMELGKPTTIKVFPLVKTVGKKPTGTVLQKANYVKLKRNPDAVSFGRMVAYCEFCGNKTEADSSEDIVFCSSGCRKAFEKDN